MVLPPAGLRWRAAAAGGPRLTLMSSSPTGRICCFSRRVAATSSPRRPANGGGVPVAVPMQTNIAGGSAAAQQQQQADVLHDVLLGRRTAGRMFDGRPVPEDVLLRAVEAATRAPYDETAAAAATIMHRRYAPNHKLTEPWRFVCLGDESVAELGRLVAEHIGGEKGEKKRKAWAAVPTWIVALCKGQTITETHTANAAQPSVMDYTQLEDYAAVCCAIQNMTLSMHTAGVTAKWSTGGVTRKDSFRQLIGASSDEMVVGVLMCGFRRSSAPALRPPMKRRPLLAVAEEDSSRPAVLCFRP